MKNTLLLFSLLLFLLSCNKNSIQNSVLVKDEAELERAIKSSQPGDEIVLANGVWKDVQINFYGIGSTEMPIILRAETPGEVFIEGNSSLHLGGEYLTVSGLYFRNGYSPENGVIRYKIGADSIANHCRVTDCVIIDFNRPNRWENDRWIEFYGRHNQMDHCYISGKSNDGVTLMVYQDGNEHINNHHQIVYNHFGPRPRKGGPRAETIRTGGSETSMTPGYVNVSHNYFEACNGEVEVISNKTNYNSYTNNIFYKCEGSLVLRHGNYATVDQNIFIGDDDSDFYGGIRAVNTGHWITNNYLYKIKGEQFRSPLAIMNGIPKSPLNRYNQVTDVVVAYNTWVDCKSAWQIGVGQNKASADVLPASEIRSAAPIRTTVANNLIYNSKKDKTPVLNHDDLSGISFINNVLDNNGSDFSNYGALQNTKLNMEKVNDWLYIPKEDQNEILEQVYEGFDFELIGKDLFGKSRAYKNKVGAITGLDKDKSFEIDKNLYGPAWFTDKTISYQGKVHKASSGDLNEIIENAGSGDIIELDVDRYELKTSLIIDKKISIRTSGPQIATIVYSGEANTPVFEMNPKGNLSLSNIAIKGNNKSLAFSPLKENMSSAFNIFMDSCVIEDFACVMEASKGSFADSIIVTNTTIQNCNSGIILAADEKGDYNAEMVTFNGCTFKNIKQNVIHFYRGGYDESTIGGYLSIKDNTFDNCGKEEESGILIKTPGIINVFITGNNFRNNHVDFVAQLWGAKNNHHSDNTLFKSGEVKVVEQQKLEILY